MDQEAVSVPALHREVAHELHEAPEGAEEAGCLPILRTQTLLFLRIYLFTE